MLINMTASAEGDDVVQVVGVTIIMEAVFVMGMKRSGL